MQTFCTSSVLFKDYNASVVLCEFLYISPKSLLVFFSGDTLDVIPYCLPNCFLKITSIFRTFDLCLRLFFLNLNRRLFFLQIPIYPRHGSLGLLLPIFPHNLLKMYPENRIGQWLIDRRGQYSQSDVY